MNEQRVHARREEDQPQHPLKSRAIWCSVVGILASVSGLFGYSMSCEDQKELLANPLVITLLSSVGSLVWRWLAKRKIKL